MKFKKLVKAADEVKSSNYDKLVEIGESLGWEIRKEFKSSIYIGQYSPAGEDFFFYIEDNEHLGKQIFEHAENFDEDEHIEMWLEAKKNGTSGVPSARELVHDAEDIQKMLDELAEATRVIW